MNSNQEVFGMLIEAIRQIKDICQNVLNGLDHLKGQNGPQSYSKQFQYNKQVKQQQSIQSHDNQFLNDMRQPELKQKKGNRIAPATSKRSKGSGAKPKAPLTPYFLFFNRKRQYIKSKYPDLSQSQMANVAGQVWRALSPQQKQPYQQEYRINKLEYSVKIRQFYKDYPDEAPLKYKRKGLQNLNVQTGQIETGNFEEGGDEQFNNDQQMYG